VQWGQVKKFKHAAISCIRTPSAAEIHNVVLRIVTFVQPKLVKLSLEDRRACSVCAGGPCKPDCEGRPRMNTFLGSKEFPPIVATMVGSKRQGQTPTALRENLTGLWGAPEAVAAVVFAVIDQDKDWRKDILNKMAKVFIKECRHCGKKFHFPDTPFYSVEFDHQQPLTKVIGMHRAGKNTWSAFLRELARVEPLHAMCHKTYGTLGPRSTLHLLAAMQGGAIVGIGEKSQSAGPGGSGDAPSDMEL